MYLYDSRRNPSKKKHVITDGGIVVVDALDGDVMIRH